MVDNFRNYVGSTISGKVEIKQLTSLMLSGVKQVRVSSIAFEEIQCNAFSGTVADNNSSINFDIGDRSNADVCPGKYECTGSIEISKDYDMWEGIINGCEMLLLESNGKIVYKSVPIAQDMMDTTATSITLDDGTVINVASFTSMPSTKTGSAWRPIDVVAGKIFLPSDFPIFDMRITVMPNTPNEHIAFYHGVNFMQMRENKGRNTPTYTIDFRAWKRTTTSFTINKGR